MNAYEKKKPLCQIKFYDFINVQIGEEESKEPKKVVWDGHTASMEKVTQKARENISIEEQIKTIHKVKGFMYVPADPSTHKRGRVRQPKSWRRLMLSTLIILVIDVAQIIKDILFYVFAIYIIKCIINQYKC